MEEGDLTKYFGAIDQGTGSSKFILFDSCGSQVASHQVATTQLFPGPNMHEQYPAEYISTVLECIERTMEKSGVAKSQVLGVGITNQRETLVAWDKTSNCPLHNAIIWDDSRTSAICEEFKASSVAFVQKTGLPLFPYFTASKIVWMLRNLDSVQNAVAAGNCRFGTVDSWLLSQLTKESPYVTDISNASRTLLMNLEGHWDPELLALFGVPQTALPEIRSCSELFGHLKEGALEGVPICASLGDQQAALLGHKCIDPGTVKNTYGTGSFLLMNTGTQKLPSHNGLLTTVFGKFGDSPVYYALEGAVEAAGSSVQWAVKQLGLASSVAEAEQLAGNVASSGGVCVVPALSGLFAPHWRSDARGLIIGLTQHSTREHVLRALFEGVAFRTGEALEALQQDSGLSVSSLSVDGGMAQNKLFLQIQADLIAVELEVPKEKDLTALGAAYAAMIGAGHLRSIEDLKYLEKPVESCIAHSMGEGERQEHWRRWREAVSRSLGWDT